MAGFPPISDDLTYLALAGTWALVVGTIFLMYWQTRRTEQLHSATTVMNLRERFDSPDFRAARRRTAKFLLNDTSETLPDLQVAAFFELMGALARTNLLDRDLIWRAFGGWVTNYLYGIRHPVDRLAASRAELRDPLLFSDFEWLADQINLRDRKELGEAAYAQLPPPEVEAQAILGREASLETFTITTPTAVSEER